MLYMSKVESLGLFDALGIDIVNLKTCDPSGIGQFFKIHGYKHLTLPGSHGKGLTIPAGLNVYKRYSEK